MEKTEMNIRSLIKLLVGWFAMTWLVGLAGCSLHVGVKEAKVTLESRPVGMFGLTAVAHTATVNLFVDPVEAVTKLADAFGGLADGS